MHRLLCRLRKTSGHSLSLVPLHHRADDGNSRVLGTQEGQPGGGHFGVGLFMYCSHGPYVVPIAAGATVEKRSVECNESMWKLYCSAQ